MDSSSPIQPQPNTQNVPLDISGSERTPAPAPVASPEEKPVIPPGFIPPKDADVPATPDVKPIIQTKVMPTSEGEAARLENNPLFGLKNELKKPVAPPITTPPLPQSKPPTMTPSFPPEPPIVKPTPPPVAADFTAGSPLGDRISRPKTVLPQTSLQEAIDGKPIDPAQKRAAIRTLQGDIAQTVHTQNLSVADIALAQQKKTRAEGFPEPVVENSGKWWVIGSGMFILFGLATVAGIFYFRPVEQLPVVEGPQETLLLADERTILDVAGMTFESFANTIRDSFLTKGTPGTIRGIALIHVLGEGDNVKHIAAEEFFSLTKSRAPQRLVRSLQEGFVFGSVTATSTPTAFLLFKTTSYETTFAGMLEWEAFMADDLPFIAYTPRPTVPEAATTTASTTLATTTTASSTTTGTTTVATTTTTSTTTPTLPPAPLPEAKFVDLVVKNKDVRALVYPDGTSRLMYAFPDKETLLIVQNKEALSILIDRLTTARFTR